LFTMASAFFGVLLNLNFLLSGSTSAGVNPLMFGLGLLILFAGSAAYVYGLDRVVQPRLKAIVRNKRSAGQIAQKPAILAH
jgi:thiosulfate dehydrogenase (quinone) large subunit